MFYKFIVFVFSSIFGFSIFGLGILVFIGEDLVLFLFVCWVVEVLKRRWFEFCNIGFVVYFC